MSAPLRIAVLGSTGSIGRQALDVAARFPERVRVVALAAHENVALLADQARAFDVRALAIGNPALAEKLGALVPDAHVGAGPDAVAALAGADGVDLVLNALVGSAGLRTSIATLTAGKVLALANKESLVVGGSLVTSLVTRPEMLIPVDSEHSAIFQCLVGENAREVSRIWLTASGGPFRGRDAATLGAVTCEEALAHPRWTMGPKITIDSATLMNKGLEAIEAYHLFGIGLDRIRIVVHPQSCVHSMVEFVDGSVKAHLGATDMRIPIQYALSHPERWDAPLAPVDFATIGSLDFEEPDYAAFPCLDLALAAGRAGGTMPAAMNAANEVAVAAFLAGRAGFMDIPRVVSAVMEAHTRENLESVEHVEAIDRTSRILAGQLL
ncbi:MAG: 1-deoxy-D-xylulose-5-phosphate reductoisomerase [Actinomycetota bacterium]|nr:MAG: 1-deoxy-D-xylulose 5-phosphate [Actinomycetota bacterium]MDP3630238.1 1-deoxy-D-xylulose-5-phosphate reductoisomerase [Actinomycetota bacterium]